MEKTLIKLEGSMKMEKTLIKLEVYVYSKEDYDIFKEKLDKINALRTEKIIWREYSGGYASVITRKPILCNDEELLYLLKNDIPFKIVR
ncbi:MAG: hypothetical protein V3U88_08675 [Methylococcales bacterium]